MEALPQLENIDEILVLAEKLESSEDEEYIKENLPVFFESMEDTLGVRVISDVNSLYNYISAENCLVRVERLTRVVAALEKNQEFEIGVGDTHYANAVIADPKGIQIAFSEGQAPGAVRLMVGFGKTIIGFKTDKIKVEKVDFAENEFRDINERAYLCRHVDGKLSKEDIKAVVMRIPRSLMKEDILTEEEKNLKTAFIFRGFALDK